MSTTIDAILKIVAKVEGKQNITQLNSEMGKLVSTEEEFEKKVAKTTKSLTSFLVVGTAAVSGLAALIGVTTKFGAELQNVSEKTGVSVQMLGRIKGAADGADVSLDAVGVSINNLNKSLISSIDKGSKQAAAFRAIGVETTTAEGKLRKVEDVFFDIADRFSEYEDGAGKSAVAMDLMGSRGADLIPVLNDGAEAIRQLGYEVGPEFTRQSQEFRDNMDAIQKDLGQVALDISADLLPGVASMAEGFADNNVVVKLLVGTIKTLSISFVGLMAAGSTVLGELGRGFGNVTISAGGLLDTMKAIATFDFKSIKDIARETDEAKAALNDAANENFKNKMLGYQKTINAIIDGDRGQGGGATPDPTNKPNINYRGNDKSGGADRAADSYKRAADAAAEWIAKQRESVETLKLETSYIGLSSIEIDKLKDARKLQTEVAERAANMTNEQAEAFKNEAKEIENARQAILQYNYDQSRTFGAGAAEFFAEYNEAATDTASQVKDALEGAFKGAEDALVEFTKTGKLSFTDMANSIIDDLIRMQIKKSITGPLSSLLGSFIPSFGPVTASANGNVMTSDGPLKLNAYANGGIANSPQVSLFGEGRTPEAYVPLPDGRTIPVTMQGGGSGQSVNVVVNVDAKGQSEAQGGTEQANQFGRSIAAAVKNVIIDEQRPGGLLQRTA